LCNVFEGRNVKMWDCNSRGRKVKNSNLSNFGSIDKGGLLCFDEELKDFCDEDDLEEGRERKVDTRLRRPAAKRLFSDSCVMLVKYMCD
jgi:hypothetical protein